MSKDVIGGRYRLEAHLGTDFFGDSHRAVDERSDRTVSLSIIAPRNATPKVVERFKRYAPVLAKLQHPNLLVVTDQGIDGGRPFIVREVAEGQTLEQLIGSQRFARENAMPILMQIAEALDFAHLAGIVHLDLTASRVVLGNGRARIADLGLMQILEDDIGLDLRAAQRKDLAAIGVLGFRMTRGNLPLDVPALEETTFTGIIDKLLVEDEAGRFTTAAQVVESLRNASSDAESLSGPDIESWVISTSAPGISTDLPTSPALEDWVVPSSAPAPAPKEDLAVPEPTFWARHRENLRITIAALYLIAIAGAMFYWAIGLPDAARDVRAMIRGRQAPQVIPQLQRYLGDPKLRAALGLAYVHVRDIRKAVKEYAAVVETDPSALEEEDVAAIVPLLGATDPTSLEAEKVVLALRDRAKARVRAAHDGSKDAYFRCRAGDVLTEMGEQAEFLPDCISALDLQSCGVRLILIDRLKGVAEAQPKLQALAAVETSSSSEDCGYTRARAALR